MALTLISGPVIAAGESVSTVLNISNATGGLRRITFPAAWDPPTVLTFQYSADNAVFSNIYAGGKLLVVPVVPGGTMFLQQDLWQSGYYKFRSGRPDNPRPQLGQRTFTCALD